jgi:hypothetical protein
MEDEAEDHLPALDTKGNWFKIVGILILLLLINLVAFAVSYGFGVIITIPLTMLMGFLVLRDMFPRHRFPPGRPPRGVAP